MTTTRCWPAGSSIATTGATSVGVRARRATPCGEAGPCPARVAADHPARAGAPLPLHRLRARLASGHHGRCGAAGEAVAPRGALGAEVGGDQPALDRPRRQRARHLLAHRERRRPGRRPTAADQRPGSPGRDAGAVRQRAARRGRSDLGCLPTHRGGLPPPGPQRRQGHTVQDHRHDQRRRPGNADRAGDPRPHLETPRRRRAGLLRPARHQQRADRSDSTAASNTSAAPPSASATSPTTSPAHYWTPAASGHEYTLFCDEPVEVLPHDGVAVDQPLELDQHRVQRHVTLAATRSRWPSIHSSRASWSAASQPARRRTSAPSGLLMTTNLMVGKPKAGPDPHSADETSR